MKFLFFFLCIATFSWQSFAQTGEITGKVVDKTNKGFPDILIFLEEHPEIRTETNLDGVYSLTVPANDSLTVIISYLDEKVSIPIYLEVNEIERLNKIRLDVQYFSGVEVIGKEKDQSLEELPVIEIQIIPGPQPSVEKYLTLTTAATSNNELTNNYNVRGGSYDENLVYVNGFQIYRPFLTRSGQQEGMSFINPTLVSNISFSAGGFAARYGDRLSSVLDIEYRTPQKFGGSFSASLLGASAHIEDRVNPRFNYMIAGRYQDQSYVLNALPVQGAYQPRFYDFQFLTNFAITENLTWSVLGHYSSNDYRFAPETQETTFGTVNQALSFKVFFEGQEITRFRTLTGATSLKWDVNKRLDMALYAMVFNTDENETFDILGQYFINELETDPSKEEFGDSVGTLGVGSFLDHARNRLFATIYSLRKEGSYKFMTISEDGLDYDQKGLLRWGATIQYEDFDDVLSEWTYIDSAGYSVPQAPAGEIQLFEVIKGRNTLKTFRTNGFLQFERSFDNTVENYPVEIERTLKDSLGNKTKELFRDTVENSRSRFMFNAGVRGGYTAFNQEIYITPRAGISYFPRIYYLDKEGVLKKRYVRLHTSTGLYYQPPFYRELRTFEGDVNLDVLSQKSFHFVSGLDYAFEMWEREMPFKFSGEIFYKYMWDVNPYEIDNVRTRYYAENSAVGHAYGLDFNLHGEFIEGTQSFFKMGLLRSIEDLRNDDYYIYFNSDGEQIYPGYTFNDTPVDSVLQSPGYIPKPTDQWFNFASLFQDRMPGFEEFTVQVGFNYGSRLPYGPPDRARHKDTLRQRAYFRADIGFGYDFLYKKPNKEDRKKFMRPFTDVRLNFEIFNLLGINNVLSQQWVQDTQGRYFAIPNYLTQRRFNLKLILRW
ncbi:MAG: TonB-dependent receptor [Brumimicrobium sp.]|nr:TonB-dependent receptor [Brumimicrobium sp.]